MLALFSIILRLAAQFWLVAVTFCLRWPQTVVANWPIDWGWPTGFL